jgi:hypothetical protein
MNALCKWWFFIVASDARQDGCGWGAAVRGKVGQSKLSKTPSAFKI